MSTNEYGLDVSYFESKFKRILSEIDRYTPSELARECARMANTANSNVLIEKEFQPTQEKMHCPKCQCTSHRLVMSDGWFCNKCDGGPYILHTNNILKEKAS